MTDLSRLCIHTITTRPWSIETATEKFAAAGVRGISVWQAALEGRDIRHTGQRVRDAGLDIVSYVRGGFFPSPSAVERERAIETNRQMIDEAQALGAPMLVLVCGAHPDQSLVASRAQIRDGIAALLPYAEAAGVSLAIEPLHPMYADTRSAIVTLGQANDMAEQISSPLVGVAVDVYHVWWDDRLYDEIQRCALHGNLLAFHVCDWRNPTRDILNDRELMGRGCIPVSDIRQFVDGTGYDGYIEVEIFSSTYWSQDQDEFLTDIIHAFRSET